MMKIMEDYPLIYKGESVEEAVKAIFKELFEKDFQQLQQHNIIEESVGIENTQDECRSFAGLIWFKADYSEIDWHGGEVEFAYADLSNDKTVLPVGCHRDYKGVKYRELPRGRVEVEGDKIVITVEKKCPKSAVDLIKKLYNLKKLENFIKEKHKSFWDPIGK